MEKNMKAAVTTRAGAYSEELTVAAAREFRDALGETAQSALAFCSADYVPHLSDFCEILRVDGHAVNVMGCTGAGWIEGKKEHEAGPGFSVLALSGPSGALPVVPLESEQSVEAITRNPLYKSINGWVALANPFTFNAEEWLEEWSVPKSGTPVVGGFASGGRSAEDTAVFLNGQVHDAVLLGIGDPLRLVPVLSQGCRPIGEPLTVTKAENNIVYSLGSRPAYEALESAFETLSDQEKATARGNLFAGLAGTEYVEDFRPGDFLVRNILGADPSSGAVVIGGIPRVGQTLQYQLRDPLSADSDLKSVLKHSVSEWGRPLASLVFACTGRGKSLFGGDGHDASLLQSQLGQHPSAGFFCNGEIAPVGPKNCIHSYSLACALIAPSTSLF
jgi:small ligand-binding sensory domain FIST